MKLKSAQYASRETQVVERFLDSALAARESGADVRASFDSVIATPGLARPKNFDALVAKMPAGTESEVLAAVMDGCDAYEAANGSAPRADMIEAAIQQGLAAFDPKDRHGNSVARLDSATSTHHDQISLQPNRAVTAIIRTIAEAIPFAGYLPVDIGSNQSKIIIGLTLAGSSFGDYTAGDSLEGIKCGGNYAMASRFLTLTTNGGAGAFAFNFYSKNLTTGEPDTGSTAVAILRGRTNLYVNGVPAGGETPNSNSSGSTSPLNGTATIAGTVYTLTGSVTPATGAITVSSSPALPAGTNAYAEAFIDYDAAPGLIPLVNVQTTTYDIFAVENRIYTANTIGSAQQMRNEAGMDPETLATVKFQDQHTMERHYKALKQARIMGSLNNARTFNFNFSTRGTQLTRAMIMQDLAATLGACSQQMANDTQDHGISHCYVGNFFSNILQGCPEGIWRPSGVPVRAGIYKLGTLFGLYEVYYSPNVVVEATDGSTSEILCIGASSQPARNPFLMGDAVPPTLIPLATNSDFKRQAGFYVRDFTAMNPHVVSSRGCALVSVTNII